MLTLDPYKYDIHIHFVFVIFPNLLRSFSFITCVIFCHQILQDSLIVTIWQCKNTPYHTEAEGKQSQRLMPFFQ